MRSTPIILLPLLLATALAAEETRVRVTADRTTLRYPNADTIEVAGVAESGQELTAIGPLEGNWTPITPPPEVSVWVYAELVRKGEVLRDKAQLRSGPGLSYKVVGSPDQGITVETRSRVGDWLKIAPPPGFHLWIRRVDIAPSSSVPAPLRPLPSSVAGGLLSALVDDTNRAATVAGGSETNSIVIACVPPPPELAARVNTAIAQQGRLVRISGTLRLTLPHATATATRYRIAGPDRTGGIVTFCHLLEAGSAAINPLEVGAQVTVEGPAWWLRGESVPVVRAEHVTFER